MGLTRAEVAAAHPGVAAIVEAIYTVDMREEPFQAGLDALLLFVGTADAGARPPAESLFVVALADAVRRRSAAALAAQIGEDNTDKDNLFPYLASIGAARAI